MNTKDIQKLYEEYILPTYSRVPVCLVKGKGSRVWDLEGKEYIDFFPGWGVSGLGHCPPAVVNAVKQQLRKIMHVSNNFLNLKQAQLAQELSEIAFPSRAFFCSSGAESIEAAIKFARRFGEGSGRYEIITMKGSFHGRTFGAMTATGQERIHTGFGPVPEGFRYAELNDLESVKTLLSDKTAAILLEPIQGEGGIQVASREFMQGLRKLCDEKGLLFMLDEVQTGMGRTGYWFAFQHFETEPDVMCIAKSLGSGVPIGALLVNRKVAEDVLVPGTHGSTYGGNPLVAAGALAVIDTIRKEKLLSRAQELGAYLEEKLEALKAQFSVICAVKGIGLMRALELNEDGACYAETALQKGLLINCTQQKTLRIMPAMTISKKLLDRGLYLLSEVFQEREAKIAV